MKLTEALVAVGATAVVGGIIAFGMKITHETRLKELEVEKARYDGMTPEQRYNLEVEEKELAIASKQAEKARADKERIDKVKSIIDNPEQLKPRTVYKTVDYTTKSTEESTEK